MTVVIVTVGANVALCCASPCLVKKGAIERLILPENKN